MNQNNSLNLPKNERKKFLADPFLFKRNNRIFCFAEEYDFNRNKGSIICSEISQNNFQRKKTILNEKFHLSFPYIFEYKKKLFMCPDTSEISEIRIYRCLKFPYKWVFHKTLKKNIRSVDSLIFKKNNLWWLFTNIDRSNTGDYNHDLSIFYSKNGPLSQNWKSHPLNPIEIDSSKSRNAGLIFKNNTLFRISQKQGFDNYGEDINFHEIKLLNTKKYNEKKVRYKDFEKIKKKLRNKDIHHFSQLGEKVIVDYK